MSTRRWHIPRKPGHYALAGLTLKSGAVVRLSPGDPPVELMAEPTKAMLRSGLCLVDESRKRLDDINAAELREELARQIETAGKLNEQLGRTKVALEGAQRDAASARSALRKAEEDLAELRADRERLRAQLDAQPEPAAPLPWMADEVDQARVIAAANAARGDDPPLKGKGAFAKAVDYLNGLPRPVALDAWRKASASPGGAE